MIIKNIRKQLGLGQLEFALVLGVSRSKIAKAESQVENLNKPALDRLKEIEDISNVEEGDIALPEVLETALRKETEKVNRWHQLEVEKKERELENGIKELEKMRSEHLGLKKSLKIFSDEINTFDRVEIRKKELIKVRDELRKKFLATAPCYQQILEIRIASLQKYLDDFYAHTGG